MKVCRQLLVIALLIVGAASTGNALDVMKLKRMLNVTMQRKNPTEKPAQEKNVQLKKMLERDKQAEKRIETQAATPIEEQKKLDYQSNNLVIALKSVEDIIEIQLDKAMYSARALYLPENWQDAVDAIKADVRPIISAIGYLQKCCKCYETNTVFNALLRVLYYTKTQNAPVLQIIFYHPEQISQKQADKLFAGELSNRIIKALIELKNLDKNFKPAVNKDSNQLETNLIERLNLKSPQQEWTKRDFLMSA